MDTHGIHDSSDATAAYNAISTIGGLRGNSPPSQYPTGLMSSAMSAVIQTGCHWAGLDAIKHLVIFGDSYSAVGYDPWAPLPTRSAPLGVPFPGETYNEPNQPNWVGHLISSHLKDRTDILVYDYAKGGDRVPSLSRQVSHHFISRLGNKPELCPWISSDTLFITWLGINDCAYVNTTEAVQDLINTLFKFQEELYESEARNFLFIDVPPAERSPAGLLSSSASLRERPTIFEKWNAELNHRARTFATVHPDATVMMFSAWDTFTRVLDNPSAYGFKEDSRQKIGGDIWFDRLHPRSAMHKIISDDIFQFLRDVQPSESKVEKEGGAENK